MQQLVVASINMDVCIALKAHRSPFLIVNLLIRAHIYQQIMMILILVATFFVAIIAMMSISRIVRGNYKEYKVGSNTTRSGRQLGPDEKLHITLINYNVMNVLFKYDFTSRVKVSLKQIEAALLKSAKRHPLLRMRIGSDRKSNYRFEPFQRPIVDIEELPDSSSDDVIEQQLGCPSIDLEKGPLWYAKFLPNAGGDFNDSKHQHGFTLLLGFSHAIVDAVSALQIAKEVVENLADDIEGHVSKDTKPFPLPEAMEDLMEIEKKLPLIIKIIRSVAKYCPKFLRARMSPIKPINIWVEKLGAEIDRASDVRPKTSFVATKLTVNETEALVRSCKAQKVSPLAALQAAILLTIARKLNIPETKLDFGTAICFRKYIGKSTTEVTDQPVATYTGQVDNEVITPENLTAPDFWAFAKQCKSSLHDDLMKKIYKMITLKSIACSFLPDPSVLKKNPQLHTAKFAKTGLRSRSVAFFNNFGDISGTNKGDDCPVRLRAFEDLVTVHNGPWHLFTVNCHTLDEEFCVTLIYFDHIVKRSNGSDILEKSKSLLLKAANNVDTVCK